MKNWEDTPPGPGPSCLWANWPEAGNEELA